MADRLTIHRDIRGKSSKRELDGLIAELSGSQHGVVSRRQLLRAGVPHDAIDHRLARKRLHPVHQGVYAIGNSVITREGSWMAATLAAGPHAVLSHRSAGAAWGLMRSGYIEVTVPTTRRRPRIHVHTSRLPQDEVTTARGIPVTDVGRTLLDLASVLRPHQLERAMNEAEIQRLTSRLSLPDLIARYPRRSGVAAVKQILERLEAGLGISQSDLEGRFLEFLRARGLPEPHVNLLVEGLQCDCVWPAQRVIVELDGRAVHTTTRAFERDRTRDRALAAAGWQTIRVTWSQLRGEPDALAADLTRILAGFRPHDLDFVTPG